MYSDISNKVQWIIFLMKQDVACYIVIRIPPTCSFESNFPVEAEISVTKVFITANMKNYKSHCRQELDVR